MIRALPGLLALLLGGCASLDVPLEDRNPAPSSSVTKVQAQFDAGVWAFGGPARAWSGVSPTGSMAPFIDSRSIVLYEAFDGRVNVGDWVYFDRGDVPNVLHRVVDVTATHVFIASVNTRGSDGWFPKSAIKYRVAGVLYTER